MFSAAMNHGVGAEGTHDRCPDGLASIDDEQPWLLNM
jgi:hypothetical protein